MTSLLSDEDALAVARILSSVRHKRALREAAEDAAASSKGRRRQGKPNTGPPRDATGELQAKEASAAKTDTR